MFRIKCLLCLFLLGMSPRLLAQRVISYEQACADIDYYFAKIDSIHPNMYWHTPKVRVDSFICALKAKLQDPVDVSRLGYELLQTQHFWDYHTNLGFTLSEKEVVFPGTDLKPSGLFLNGRKILSVNQVNVKDILSVVSRFKGCDTPWPTYYYQANRAFHVSIAIYGMELKPPYQVMFEGAVEPEEVEGVYYGKLWSKANLMEKDVDLQVFPSDSIAVIYFNQCTNNLEKVETFLLRAFKYIADYHVKNLFIDVSRNPGGTTDAADLFLKYIHFDNKKSCYYQWIKRKGMQGRGYCNEIPEEQPMAFKGNIYVYQSCATRSAGPWIGEVLRAFSRAVIVGTPTEATLPVYIDSKRFRLPNSRFHLGVSHKYFYQEEPQIPRTEWGGVKPDIDYPFLMDRRLSLDDCRKIIELDPGNILEDGKNRKDIREVAEVIDRRIEEAMDAKDYRRAEKMIREFIAYFHNCSQGIQEMYKERLGSVYYYLAFNQSLQHKRQPALDAFAKAIECGWHNYSHARQDRDLDFIRTDPKFEELMQSIREKGDFLYILQQSGGYVQGDTSLKAIHFTYMNPSDPNLERVRRYFNLDSIAGSGDEISKIKNLMGWVHDIVRHDGSSDNPKSKNAIDMVELCRKENRGVNCRMMAQILNECYLAMGFKSRFVTCMPKFYESDCHVINVVYSDSLRKWVWMDPTFDAWVTDESGVLLGIAEVRERLRRGLPLILNEEANWNHKIKQTREKYLENYMAKNLYYLICPLRSEFNAETYFDGKIWSPDAILIPQGYHPDENPKYLTCDDEWFWQIPVESINQNN